MTVINLTDPITLRSAMKTIDMSKVGYVYLLEDVKRGMVKIGRSQNPTQRLDTIRTSAGILGGREYVTHRVQDSSSLEISMHNVFSEYRFNGEWFEVDFEKAVTELQSLTPEELGVEEFEKARAIARKNADKSAEALMQSFHQQESHPTHILGPNEQISFITTQLFTIKKYAEIQEAMFRSLGEDIPKLNGISGGFSDMNSMVIDLISFLSSFGKFYNSTLCSLGSDDAATLCEIIKKQLSHQK